MGFIAYIFIATCVAFFSMNAGAEVFVDKGVPYANGPKLVGELAITVTTEDSPRHVKAFFPLGEGDFPVIYYIGGLSSLVPSELYSIILSKIAAHGFFVFGVDYYFPADSVKQDGQGVGDAVDVYFREFNFLQKFMVNKTVGVPRWDLTGLLCHSAGCGDTLDMIEKNIFPFKATIFMEPYSQVVHANKTMAITVPALMYGTQLAEEGLPRCNVPGYDYLQFYDVWKCPRIAIKVADFGHCDMLDPVGWEACHLTHFCKTNNDTQLNHYRQTVHGIVSGFFIATLQGYGQSIVYVQDVKNIPIKVLVSKNDWNC
ncbi:uncharacterized protein LOC128244124 [Mya arenaria]|uniref:uncharacterized protein LOC128244124 n=1 Tax=Mya arenaria TaxID=6604 RepID=UPI0022E6C1E3|nr:uncharacterized protein LOC128244124 [Mya arenaria]